jgi:hypothetical protein
VPQEYPADILIFAEPIDLFDAGAADLLTTKYNGKIIAISHNNKQQVDTGITKKR